MHQTKRKRHRTRRRIRRILWRTGICLGAVMLLAVTWKLTSSAISLLLPSAQKTETSAQNSDNAGAVSENSNGNATSDEKQADSNSSKSDHAVETGDTTTIMPFAVLIVAAAVIIGAVVFLKKKKK